MSLLQVLSIFLLVICVPLRLSKDFLESSEINAVSRYLLQPPLVFIYIYTIFLGCVLIKIMNFKTNFAIEDTHEDCVLINTLDTLDKKSC